MHQPSVPTSLSQSADTVTSLNTDTQPHASPQQPNTTSPDDKPAKKKKPRKRRAPPRLVNSSELSSKLLDETIESVARATDSLSAEREAMEMERMDERSNSPRKTASFLENPTAFMAEQTAIVNSKLEGTSPTRDNAMMEISAPLRPASLGNDKKESEIVKLLNSPPASKVLANKAWKSLALNSASSQQSSQNQEVNIKQEENKSDSLAVKVEKPDERSPPVIETTKSDDKLKVKPPPIELAQINSCDMSDDSPPVATSTPKNTMALTLPSNNNTTTGKLYIKNESLYQFIKL